MRHPTAPQPARIFAFSAANSSSVSTPEALSSPRDLSWSSLLEVSGPVRCSGTAGGSSAYSSSAGPGSGACSSWYFRACRRWTRPLTAVAVPATTAVRAAMRSNLGMSGSCGCRGEGLRFGGVGGFQCVEYVHDVLGRDAGTGDEFAPRLSCGGDEGHRPRVLVDDQDGERAGLHGARGLVHVLVAEQTGPDPGQLGEPAQLLHVLRQVDRVDAAVVVLVDDEDVVERHDPLVDEVEHRLRPAAGEPVGRELDEQEVDRAVHVWRCHVRSSPTDGGSLGAMTALSGRGG